MSDLDAVFKQRFVQVLDHCVCFVCPAQTTKTIANVRLKFCGAAPLPNVARLYGVRGDARTYSRSRGRRTMTMMHAGPRTPLSLPLSCFAAHSLLPQYLTMCWSAPVSCMFGTLDLLAILFLLNRSKGRDVTYACLLGSIAFQEWAQFLVWWSDSAVESQEECTMHKALIGIHTFLGSNSIPAVLIWRSVVDHRQSSASLSASAEHHPPPASNDENNNTIVLLRIKAFVLWITSTLLVVVAAIYTNSYCIMVGPRHHQIWICAQSIYKLGGYPLYFVSLTMYGSSIVYGLIALNLPHKERLWIGWIGFVCGVVSYGLYFYTLEACSIWCWSAFSIGVYLCLRQPI